MSKNSKTTTKHEVTEAIDQYGTVAAIDPIVVEVPAEAEPAKTRKPKRLTEDQLLAKYPHILVGTLRFETEGHHNGKQTIEADLPCGHIARVATSDLFQVKACPDCKKATKKAKAEAAEVKAEAAEAKVAKKPLTGAAYNKPVTSLVTLIPAEDEALTEANA